MGSAGLPLEMVAQRLREAELLLATKRTDGGTDAVTLLGVTQDSRQVASGDLFLAWKGLDYDAHEFLSQAEASGAVAAVVERISPDLAITQLQVRDGRLAGALAADMVLGSPWTGVFLAGITGTNGKTTVAVLAHHLLNQRGPTRAVGTLGLVDEPGTVRPGTEGLTTPGPVQISTWIREMADDGVAHATLEASSHALDQHRLAGVRFDVAVFTNLSQDHLDYHCDLEAYRSAKARLLDLLKPGAQVVLNWDEEAWSGLPVSSDQALYFGFGDTHASATPERGLWAESVSLLPFGCRFRIREGREEAWVDLPLLGRFNVENALAAAAVARVAGLSFHEIAEGLSSAPQIPGRLEKVADTPASVLIDFAHTPDALERVLSTLRPLVEGRLLVVFGAGGDRDRSKRPLMGEVAARLADHAFVTSDNPRTEDPDAIIDEVVAGMGSVSHRRISDRREAVLAALQEARPGDLLLLAGKGHENYQVVGLQKLPFDEGAIVREFLKSKKLGGWLMTFQWTEVEVRTALDLNPERGSADAVYSEICTDSRKVQPEALFVALVGERFDGHDFVMEALARGATGAVVSRSVDAGDSVRLYPVPDTTEALGNLALHRRNRLKAKVVGITGSAGKTMAKDLLGEALRGTFRVHSTPGNLNNRIGLPQTLLLAPMDTQVLVLEMGTNEPGEIRALTEVARPSLGVLTTVGETHLEKLGSVEGVLEEKLDLIRGLAEDGLAIVGDEPPELRERARGLVPDLRVAGWSEEADPDLRPEGPELTENGCYRFQWRGQRIQLRIPGRHAVSNALLALAAAEALGVPARDAARRISKVLPGNMRSEVRPLGSLTLLADCYNASPQSVRAALDLLTSFQQLGPRVAVLGSMLELGDGSRLLHRQVLEDALSRPLDLIVATGLFAEAVQWIQVPSDGPKLVSAPELGEAEQVLLESLGGAEIVLLKASRGVAMERLIPALEERFGETGETGETGECGESGSREETGGPSGFGAAGLSYQAEFSGSSSAQRLMGKGV